MEEIMLKIDNVSKMYKLGQIGGTTLRDELQRKKAKLLKKEDPTKKIGAKDYNKGETFMALNGVSFEVKKGERVGIIGHNGAGKSTLLKLLSRVTAPTTGEIGLNGRIASMLEVGTGFHPELTGRENIYMNGAILGMTKKEIDTKIDQIIEFSECGKFIDTPVKRYSSGMYVKLAFSVAAHLDSEILVMDEVLAVGDMKFQQKCLGKMGEVSENDGRTVLYVSHNMNTIRQLCTRCIVLDHGKLIFDGDVENAIGIYMDNYSELVTDIVLSDKKRPEYLGKNIKCRINRISVINSSDGIVRNSEPLDLTIKWKSFENLRNVKIRIQFRAMGHGVATIFTGKPMDLEKNVAYEKVFHLDISSLCSELYETTFVLFQEDNGYSIDLDCIHGITIQKIIDDESFLNWNAAAWGYVKLPDA